MQKPRLITIPISHFCEKARWGLERAGIEYQEERHLQLFHHWYARRAGGRYTTPVLVLPGGVAIGNSSAILRWVDQQLPQQRRLYPAQLASRARATEQWLDRTLGPDGRAWMYSYVLREPQIVAEFGLVGVPAFERRMFNLMVGSMGPYIKTRSKIDGSSTDVSRVKDVFDEIAARLEDGRPYLLGETFTAADLTFAALSASVVVPHNYGVELPPVERLPSEMRQQVKEFRAHPAGQFALRMFDTERHLVLQSG